MTRGAPTRVRLVVLGIVQGVGFRHATREAAAERGVHGWVRNLSDGSVEIVAQGSDEAVALMIAWAERGPRHARVERVDVVREPPQPGLEGFDIRR